jgi:hypothetical protein
VCQPKPQDLLSVVKQQSEDDFVPVTMNTFQLWYALTSNPVTARTFDGVFAKDTLCTIQAPSGLLICNTDSSDKPGKHWLLLYHHGDTLEYFDSLGKDIQEYGDEFVTFAKRIKATKVVTIINERIQPKGTSLCGDYCLYYAYARMKGQSMNDIVRFIPSSQTLCDFVRDIYCINDDTDNNFAQLCNQACCSL